ncbi:MAG: PD-(D/E)XK nuclease family protein, partial [Planctomycetes bacterium]|nr:PD-(D/E)XK nuclease family protein [Planctomycetota bacterium]
LRLPPHVVAQLGEPLKGSDPVRQVHLEVFTERGFAIREGSRVVKGSIDRLVLMYAGNELLAADIIDFKTDALPAGNDKALDERVEHYRGQLEAYIPAVQQVYGLERDRISARLLMLSDGSVATV